jgi:protein required for attachment to host cells
MGTHRSAVGQTDWHDRAERSFAAGVAATLEALCRDGRTPAIVIAAPPRTLAELREACPDALKRLIVAEIDKDLTKLPTDEIERYLTR